MQIKQHLHTAILVSNLAKSKYFYETILGLVPIERVLKYPGVWYEIGDFQLHLILDESVKNKLHNPAEWGRNPHLALGVVNLNQTIAELKLLALPFIMSSSGREALFLPDPDGNILELTQT